VIENKRVSACFAACPVLRVATPDLSGHWQGGRAMSTAIACARMRTQCHVDAASLGDAVMARRSLLLIIPDLHRKSFSIWLKG
jgi:hypothetical protein